MTKYNTQKVIAIDVDGTLIINNVINDKLVTWCKQQKAAGYYMILWSARGKVHAEQAAKISELIDTFDTIISKPGYIVDDKGWSWIKYTKNVTNLIFNKQ